uniref:Uncharacterized protein n=1 Tax=Zea mays TaxID=4577 RepID=B6TZZ9_MAIZE|nr:hypothetical protein [Zea mays]ACG43845.1 hypothetical protein [Zea mays]
MGVHRLTQLGLNLHLEEHVFYISAHSLLVEYCKFFVGAPLRWAPSRLIKREALLAGLATVAHKACHKPMTDGQPCSGGARQPAVVAALAAGCVVRYLKKMVVAVAHLLHSPSCKEATSNNMQTHNHERLAQCGQRQLPLTLHRCLDLQQPLLNHQERGLHLCEISPYVGPQVHHRWRW